MKYIPVSRQLTDTLRNGYRLLEDGARAEVARFIEGRQHATGLFMDRDDNPDLYYTLFGTWLCQAAGLTHLTGRLGFYLNRNDLQKYCRSDADRFAALIVKQSISGDNRSNEGFSYLARLIIKPDNSISIAYRLFFLLLLLDNHPGRRSFFRFIAVISLPFFRFSADLPGSFIAAMILAKLSAGLKVQKEVACLQSYFESGKGFKIFRDIKDADTLSTGVSLFALQKAGADLRPVAADCLDLITENYRSGAFIAGEGDETRDLEYTFYGLLAAGSLE